MIRYRDWIEPDVGSIGVEWEGYWEVGDMKERGGPPLLAVYVSESERG